VGEMRGYDRYLSHIEVIMRKLNQHLPKNRKSLDKLLCEKEPYVELADGNRHYFKRKDLALASELVPMDQRNKIMLPIVVVRRVEFGEGAYIVLGGKAEKQIILKVLELTDTMYGSKELFIYKPHIQKLLKELGSLITIGFDIPIRY
jgi:uncharacterized protein (UPF0216 family)